MLTFEYSTGASVIHVIKSKLIESLIEPNLLKTLEQTPDMSMF